MREMVVLRVLLLLITSFLGFGLSQTQTPTNRTYVEIAFINNQIVPNIIDNAPRQSILIQYPQETIDLGERVSPANTRTIPTIYWSVTPNTSEYYTLLMVDPDSPARLLPLLRENLHWLVINVRGSNVTSGQTIVEYLRPSPGFGTGFHRYVFLAFRQQGRFDLKRFGPILRSDLFNRVKFNTRSFIRSQNLTGPIAGNYFEADFDRRLFAFVDKILTRAQSLNL